MYRGVVRVQHRPLCCRNKRGILLVEVVNGRLQRQWLVENSPCGTSKKLDTTKRCFHQLDIVLEHRRGSVQQMMAIKEQSKRLPDRGARGEKLGMFGDLGLQTTMSIIQKNKDYFRKKKP